MLSGLLHSLHRRQAVLPALSWLNDEGGEFATSAGRGVFVDQAGDLLRRDRWRWGLIANASGEFDTDFCFARLATAVDHGLADTFGNFVQRLLSFVISRYDSVAPDGAPSGPPEAKLHAEIGRLLDEFRQRHEALSLRGTADTVRAKWIGDIAAVPALPSKQALNRIPVGAHGGSGSVIQRTTFRLGVGVAAPLCYWSGNGIKIGLSERRNDFCVCTRATALERREAIARIYKYIRVGLLVVA